MKKYLLIISGVILFVQFYLIMAPSNNSLNDANNLPVMPDFSLPLLSDQSQTITPSHLKNENIRIINFYASWCGPCIIEHPLLMGLKNRNYNILGIDYMDEKAAATRFLENMGDPYQLSVWDVEGVTSYTWGITSIPQTFVIDNDERVIYHKTGRLLSEDVTNHILPLLE